MSFCRRVVEFLLDIDPTCPSRDLPAAVRAHLAWCPGCRAEALGQAAAVRLARLAVGESEPARPVPERLVRAVLERWRAESLG